MTMRIYDNGGRTFDRYTILPDRWTRGQSRRTPGGLLWEGTAASEHPYHPQGFGQHVEAMAGPHLGKRITLADLPPDVQRFVLDNFGD
jgi:hypothetical protein